MRLLVQAACFFLLLYGGFAVEALAGVQSGDKPPPGRVELVERAPTSTPLYLPVTTCIYQKKGLCRGCSLYYLTEALVWRHPVERWLPYGLVLIFLMLLLGRLWCGWVCPLGFLSDLLTRARLALHLPQLRLSPAVRDGLVWTKYILLALVLGLAALAGWPGMEGVRNDLMDPFCQICPTRVFAPLFTFDTVCWTNFASPAGVVFTLLGLLAFGLFFGGLAVRRFWCRLCPIGGLSALFNRSGLVSLVKDARRCTRCGACARSCPLDVRRVFEGRGRKAVTAFECHLCLRCVEACPEPGCLQFQWLGKRVSGK
ncbi:MAG: 4Fe-4S binding protein [Deltaproteobacteria bacterium]|nr:4Fe-4S binding protein [Deltaproteobacteria bacterium]